MGADEQEQMDTWKPPIGLLDKIYAGCFLFMQQRKGGGMHVKRDVLSVFLP